MPSGPWSYSLTRDLKPIRLDFNIQRMWPEQRLNPDYAPLIFNFPEQLNYSGGKGLLLTNKK